MKNIYEIRSVPGDDLEGYLRVTGGTDKPTTDNWYPLYTHRIICVQEEFRGQPFDISSDEALQMWTDIFNERLKEEGSRQRIRTRDEDHGLGPDFQFIDIDRHGGEETIDLMYI